MGPERREIDGSHFTHRERQVINGLYIPNKPNTLEKLGQELGITKERVRQLSDSVFIKFVARYAFLTTRSRPDIDERNLDVVVHATRSHLKNLTPRELQVIGARYLTDKAVSQVEVGRRMGVSTQRVSELERGALRKLRGKSKTREL